MIIEIVNQIEVLILNGVVFVGGLLDKIKLEFN